MNSRNASSITLVNADPSFGGPTSLRMSGARIAELNGSPGTHDFVVDLTGCRLLPGLINAHDHLQLNSFPPLDFDFTFDNASAWATAIQARLASDRIFAASVAVSRRSRLFAGGLKNLLSGVTTVAHHDPHYPELDEVEFPVHVPRCMGWSHSLALDGRGKVRASHDQTDPACAWIIHAAEGTDAAAAAEFQILRELGCVSSNTLLVHGIALTMEQRRLMTEAQAGLIWCPSSNLKLFGRTALVKDLLPAGRVALGTDSRMTGSRDLLDELRAACHHIRLSNAALESLVTTASASLLRLPDRGRLCVGARADLVVLPARVPLPEISRADVRAAIVDGAVRYGDRDLSCALDPHGVFTAIEVDGRSKVLQHTIARHALNLGVLEPGVRIGSTQECAA